ncbi:MAG: thiolase family protein [Bacteriovoracaceae bacterium]|jgi:acetyl-CoA C-acetyltransferase|nr:acetyl-CoA C-acyltransferase [Halobacteriovoraceae bacterium]MDP7320403.1 thiolase family protein [Bacteriovoracaceae bacterium]|tara:strand:- start:1177 stop:2337 length:1161 start_codon:yes stop_codon:yes gene_type:complete
MSIYILGGARTPQGSFLGSLSTVSAPKLGAQAIKGALEQAQVKNNQVDEVVMGNVIQAGVGQAPARQAALFAGLDQSTPCLTVNKVCGSGLQSVILAAKSLLAKEAKLVVAGGMENMSLAPHLLPNSRIGAKFGGVEMKDSMQWDGLWDVYSDRPMGNCAEECTTKYELTRQAQDEFAINSFKKAQSAQKEGVFKSEISPVVIKGRKGEVVVEEDEGPGKVKFEKVASLRPAFDKNGTITAANASTINDGACALVLGGEEYKDQAKFKILGWASHAQDPTWFTTAPVEAVKKNLAKLDLNINDIDLWEINEAFAAVTMVAIKELQLDEKKVNIYGGAVSLGHPIGASGARILLTLTNAMERTKAKRGCAAICIGGGEALSMVIERI